MKKDIILKVVKVIYLVCCLVVAFTPNILTDDSVYGEKAQTQITWIDTGNESDEKRYDKQFKSLEQHELSKHEGLTSTIISVDGKVIYEKYFNGNDESSTFEIHSCTKTIIAILTGIAHDQKMMGDEKSKYIDMFQGLDVPEVSDGFEDITIEDMLSMSSGINWDKYSNLWSTKISIIRNGLDYGRNTIPSAALAHRHGEHFNYNSNESRSLMAMVAYKSGMEDYEFAEKYLFNKLGIKDYLWPYNDSGLLPGGKDLFLSARDMWKVGQLLLDKGVYEGQQIISQEWIDKMLTPVKKDVPAEDILPVDRLDYGYYMWHTTYKDVDVNYAYGRGGQCIFLVPQYDICVVTSAIDKERNDSFRNIVYDVIDIYEGKYSYE